LEIIASSEDILEILNELSHYMESGDYEVWIVIEKIDKVSTEIKRQMDVKDGMFGWWEGKEGAAQIMWKSA
jgi:hypothetical protein